MEAHPIKIYEIDAKGRSLGRVATDVAIMLRGKNKADYQPHLTPNNKVRILNANQIVVTGRKMKDKEYIRYTGYPGGLRSETMEHLVARKGNSEIIKKAIYGMLPNNKLRSICMKNLEIVE